MLLFPFKSFNDYIEQQAGNLLSALRKDGVIKQIKGKRWTLVEP
jgi:hypothetical protein